MHKLSIRKEVLSILNLLSKVSKKLMMILHTILEKRGQNEDTHLESDVIKCH